MINKLINNFLKILILIVFTSCSNSSSRFLNPYYEAPTQNALLGNPNDHALNGGSSSNMNARGALEALGTYRKAHLPQPVNPIIQPSVVRVMWVPDHLNSYGDLIPAHYYYLKVLDDRWALQDAFEIEQQTNTDSNSNDLPFIYK